MSGHHPSQAGTELVPHSVPGLPIRPQKNITIFPLEGSDEIEERGSVSASAELANALGGRAPMEAQGSADEVEPTGARDPRRAPSPDDPTEAEVEAHKLSGHVCFRSWCRHCVRGRGSEAAHASTKPLPSALPVLSWDYCYLSSREEARAAADGESPVLVMWDSKGKGLGAHIIPAKGVDFEGIDKVLRMVTADLDRLGYKRVAFRSDQEPAITAFLREVKRCWHGEVVPELAATGDPQTNGAAENGVKLLKGLVRTLKDALEFNLGTEVSPTSGLMSLIVKQAAAAYRLYAVGSDGRTPQERNTGRRHRPAVAEFGESIWWMPLQTSANRLPPLGARFEEGYFMGMADGSSECLILTPTGLVRCRTIRRRPLGERWNQALLHITNVSELQPNRLQEGETRIGIRAPVIIEPVAGEPTAIPLIPVARIPRRTQLRRTDFAEHGYTPGCPGCDTIQFGYGEAHHNGACRARMEPLLQQSEAGRSRIDNALERAQRFAAVSIGADRKKLRGGESSSETAAFGSSSSVPFSSDVAAAPAPRDAPAPMDEILSPSSSAAAAPPMVDTVPARRKRPAEEHLEAPADAYLRTDDGPPPAATAAQAAQPTGRKRMAEEPLEGPADAYLRIDEPSTSSSSTAVVTPLPPVAPSVLAASSHAADIMSLHVGAAFTLDTRGSISEIYSPPRIAPHAEDHGFAPGWSLDLTTTDDAGRAWDFSRHDCRERARRLLKETRPLLLIGSPMCTWFSALQHFNKGKVDTAEWEAGFQRAVEHIKFVFELYDLQVRGGRYFLHEHPAQATSWQLPTVVELCSRYPHLYAVIGAMCAFGLTTPGEDGKEQPAQKLTRWLTNSPFLAATLERKCPRDHAHTVLLNGRAKAAQVYPPALCRAVVAGFAEQLRADNDRINSFPVLPVPPAELPTFNLELLQVDGEDIDEGEWVAEDDVHGGSLPPDLVMEARRKEIKYIHSRKVYSYATEDDAFRLTRKRPIKLKWIDTNKGDRQNMNIRSRLVCTEIRRKGTEAVFSATPPLESLRALIARAASEPPIASSDPYKIMLVDVSRAHFYADAVRHVFIQLPAEDPQSSVPGACGKLEKTMYGTLDAAERWGEHYAETLVKAGFVRGVASPCHFHHPVKDIWCLVHGDDFVIVARGEGRAHAEAVLRAAYEVKVDVAGPEASDPKSIKILGRIVSYTDGGILYEADPGHMESVIADLGLNDGKGVATPGVKEDSEVGAAELVSRRKSYAPPVFDVTSEGEIHAQEADEGDGSPALVGEQLHRYQSMAAKLNYFAMDRPDLLYAVKELMRRLSKPTEEDWGKLKRCARYLLTVPRLVFQYPWNALPSTLSIYTDADHAGCMRTRKSTSGGAIMWGKCLLKSWSRTQTLIALSSGESELAAVTKAAAEGFGVQAVLQDFGFPVKIEVHSDATAAIGICKRQGLGRVRHLATADLWVQQRVRAKQIKLFKLPGRENPSDMMTKYKSSPELGKFLKMLGVAPMRGRPSLAPARVATAALTASRADEVRRLW